MPQTVRDRLKAKYRATGPTPEETPVETTAPIEAVPGIPDEDDIVDPPVPTRAVEPLVVDPFADIKDDIRCFMKAQDGMWLAIEKRLASLSPADAGALQHLCEALEGLKAGLVVSSAPYACTMQALTPQGFPVSVSIARQDGEAFFIAVTAMAGWLASQHYTAPPAAVAF